jgi:hypothetical protein
MKTTNLRIEHSHRLSISYPNILNPKLQNPKLFKHHHDTTSGKFIPDLS